MTDESTCKPGSVPVTSTGGDHPSATAVASGLVRSTREHGAGRPSAQIGVPILLTLLQVGFTEPTQSPASLVVSYTTVSPLPPLTRRRFAFCGTDPAGHPGWALPTTLPCGARTFLDSAAYAAPPRSPGRLVRRVPRVAGSLRNRADPAATE